MEAKEQTAKRTCLSSPQDYSPKGKEETNRTLPERSSSPPLQRKDEKKDGPSKSSSSTTTSSSSTASLALSVSSLTSQPARSTVPPPSSSSSGLSSLNSSCHPRSPAIISHGSPTMIPLPHPATPSHPALSSSFMVFPPHSPLLSYSSPSSIPDVYRGPHHLVPPAGLIPFPPVPGGPPAVPHHLRLSSTDIPQDLSLKSGTVTA